MLGFTKSSFNLNRLLSHNINYKNLRFKGTDVVLSTLKSRNHLNLPRLPIPNLSDTLDRYVKSVKPLTLDSNFVDRKLNGDVSSFSRTSSLVDDASTSSLFLEAQASLLEKDKKRTSYPHFYFEHLWDEMYLTLRCPNPIHVSPAYVLKPPSSNNMSVSQTRRAACLIYSALQWYKRAQRGEFPEEVRAQCVSQVSTLYGATRVPKRSRDVLLTNPDSSHITIQRGGRIYKMNVLNDQHEVRSIASIESYLERLIHDVDRRRSGNDDGLGVGLLTSTDRDVWADVRSKMEESSALNRQSFDIMDRSLLNVALDVPYKAQNTLLQRTRNALHGQVETRRDRWWDKLQLIVGDDATTMFQFEHSHSDGAAWNYWLEGVVRDAERGEIVAEVSASCAESPPLEELKWECHDEDLAHARSEFDREINRLRTNVIKIEDIGRSKLKSLKISPDFVAQLAFAAAFRELHGFSAPTYEACSTRGFWHGRTETIRSFTTEMRDAVHVLLKGGGTECADVLRNAAKAHGSLARDAASGEGIDRHLMCLEREIIDNNESLDGTFMSEPLFSQSKQWALSTSNVSCGFLDMFAFGPVIEGGYGLGYQILGDEIPICVTSFNGGPNEGYDLDTDADMFAERTEALLRRAVGVLESDL